MVGWKAKGISKNSVQQLESNDAPACLAAFLLSYEADSGEMFGKLKEAVKKVFKKEWIYGNTFVRANEEEKKALFEVLTAALKDVTKGDATKLKEMWVSEFMQLASK